MTTSDARRVLAANLDTLMRLKGWTAPTLERKAGVSDSSINNIRSGAMNATIETVEKIAHAFNLPAWALLLPNLDTSARGADLTNLIARYFAAGQDGRIAVLRLALSESRLAHDPNGEIDH